MAAGNTEKATAQLTAESGSGGPVTGSSMTAAANNSTQFFDFFALPRELRDKIYEQPVLSEYEHLPTKSEDDLITKAKKLRTSLLSVSRQFRDEYAERCAGQQVLCMRDHCATWADRVVLPSSNRAHLWTIEFFIMSEYTNYDLNMFKAFLDLQTGSNVTVRSINIKLLFEETRDEIESGSVRRALSDLQACEKVASLEIYLIQKLWDYKGSGKPKFLIARWDRSDGMNIDFLKPAIEIYDMGSEWGHPNDVTPDCCDPSKIKYYGDSEDDGGTSSSTANNDESESGSEADGEDDNCNDHAGDEDDNGDNEHDDEGLEGVDGHENGGDVDD